MAGRFKSRAQWRWAFANRMPWARQWAHRARSYRALPRRTRGGRRRR